MEKLKFKYHLKNEDLLTEFSGICLYYSDKKILAFQEANGTQVFIDIARLLMTRENDEMLLVLDFNNGNSYVQMKKMNKRIDMPTEINNRKIEDNKFMVNYTLSSNNNFDFIFEWNLGGE